MNCVHRPIFIWHMFPQTEFRRSIFYVSPLLYSSVFGGILGKSRSWQFNWEYLRLMPLFRPWFLINKKAFTCRKTLSGLFNAITIVLSGVKIVDGKTYLIDLPLFGRNPKILSFKYGTEINQPYWFAELNNCTSPADRMIIVDQIKEQRDFTMSQIYNVLEDIVVWSQEFSETQ